MDWKFLIDQQESSSKLRFIKWNKIRKISRSRNIKIRIFLQLLKCKNIQLLSFLVYQQQILCGLTLLDIVLKEGKFLVWYLESKTWLSSISSWTCLACQDNFLTIRRIYLHSRKDFRISRKGSRSTRSYLRQARSGDNFPSLGYLFRSRENSQYQLGICLEAPKFSWTYSPCFLCFLDCLLSCQTTPKPG